MSRHQRARHHSRRARLISLVFGGLVPQVARAHPLDEFRQLTYITVAPNQIVVELDLWPGELVVPELLPVLDPDGDSEISEAEARAYAEMVLEQLVLQVDGQSLALTIASIEMPSYTNIAIGYGQIRIFTAAALPSGLTGAHTIAYRNTYAPTGSTYQVNTFVERDAPITLGRQNRDSIQQSLTVDYAINR